MYGTSVLSELFLTFPFACIAYVRSKQEEWTGCCEKWKCLKCLKIVMDSHCCCNKEHQVCPCCFSKACIAKKKLGQISLALVSISWENNSKYFYNPCFNGTSQHLKRDGTNSQIIIIMQKSRQQLMIYFAVFFSFLSSPGNYVVGRVKSVSHTQKERVKAI